MTPGYRHGVVPRTAEVAALEDSAWSIFTAIGMGPGGRVLDTPTRLVVETPVPQPPYNAVHRFYDEGDRPVGEQIAELLDPMSARPVTPAWLVHPSTDNSVPSELSAYGWTCAEQILGMVADLTDVWAPPDPIAGVEMFEATPAHSDLWVELVSWRYGLDTTASPYLRAVYEQSLGRHTRLWVATIDDQPVSKVAVHLTGSVAGVYGVVTTEAGRGRGIASGLTSIALRSVRAAGARQSVLHSTPMARSMYRRLGYRDVATFEVWAEPDAVHL